MLRTPNLQITRINLKDKRKLFISAFAVLLLVLLLLAGLTTLANIGNPHFRGKTSGPVRDATLTLNAGDLTNLIVNQTFTVYIGMTSPTQDFYGVDVVLDFDETLLVVEDITNVGSEIPDGCTTGGTPGTYAILTPTTSDQPTGCDFRTSDVVSDADTNGVVDFGIMAYDWEEAIQNPSYVPTPIASGTYTVLARVTFKAIATGTNADAIKFLADLNCTHQFCGTTESNVLALSSPQIRGDILSALNPTSLSVTINEASPGPLQKITLEIKASTDDAEEKNDNTMELDSSDLDMMQISSPHQAVGLRYNGVNIPQGATITNAYVEFTADESNSEATNLTISGEKIGNAPTFTSADQDITSRSKTTAQVAWDNVPAWTKGEDHQTPDIKSIVQEIVAQGDWALGNSLALIVEGTGERVAETYDGGSTDDSALLTVEFQARGYAYEPTDDSYVRSGNPKKNYGSRKKIDVDGDGSEPIEIAYFKFDLTGVTNINTALLRLYVTNKSDDDTQTVKEVDDVSWSEKTLIYNNRPEATQTFTIVGPTHNAGTTLDIDLTSYLSSKTGQLASLAIEQIGTNKIKFSSKETANNHPQLIIYGQAGPPPSHVD